MKLLLLCLLSHYTISAHWTVFIHGETFELKDNIMNQLQHVAQYYKKKSNITIAIQLYEKYTLKRFIVDEGYLKELQSLQSVGPAQDFYEGLKWAYSTYPSTYKMVILSGHGYGVVKPLWNSERQCWYFEIEKSIDHDKEDFFEHMNHKFLLPRNGKEYLSLKNLKHGLSQMQKELGKESHIDIIGIDSCAMAMVEVADLLSSSCRYFIASQECEVKSGWDYRSLIKSIVRYQKPSSVARAVVYAYQQQCKDKKIQRYTLAAFNLTHMNFFKEKFEVMIQELEKCLKADPSLFTRVMLKARQRTSIFCCAPFYKDLYTFLHLLDQELDIIMQDAKIMVLRNSIKKVLLALDQLIIANVASPFLQAQGLSLYIPLVYDINYETPNFSHAWTRIISNNYLAV